MDEEIPKGPARQVEEKDVKAMFKIVKLSIDNSKKSKMDVSVLDLVYEESKAQFSDRSYVDALLDVLVEREKIDVDRNMKSVHMLV